MNAHWTMRCWFLVVLLAGGGCGTAVFRNPRLMTLDLRDAGLPVMLSATPGAPAGRPIVASAESSAAVSTVTASGSAGSLSVTLASQRESELDLTTRFMVNVRRADRWLEVRGIRWVADDFTAYGASKSERSMAVDAIAHH